MSPEQCRGDTVDPRSDLYALGCVAYTLLSGAPPFKRDSLVGYLLAHVQQPPPDLAAVSSQAIPDWLVAWVARCLEKEPSRRFASAEQARAELALQRSNLPTGPLSGQLPGFFYRTVNRIPAPRKSSPRLWLGLGALAVVLVALALTLAGPSSSPVDPTPEQVAVATPTPPVPTPTPSITPQEPTPTPEPPPQDPVPAAEVAAQVAVPPMEIDEPEPGATSPASTALAELPAPTPPPAPHVIRLESTPTGARVTQNGVHLGTTPLDITWPAGAAPPDLHLEAPGHVRQPVSLTDLTPGDTHKVTLARTRPTPRTSTSPATQAATPPKPTTPKPTSPTARPPSDFIRIEDSP